MRLTDNLERIAARPLTVFFACYVIGIIMTGEIRAFAAKGSAVSLAFAIIVLVRIYKGRAGPSSVRAAAVFFIIPVFLFGASMRVYDAQEQSSLKESLKDLKSSAECSFTGVITDISLDNEKTVYYIKKALIDGFEGSVKVTVSEVYNGCFRVGDTVTGSGKIRNPMKAANPGGFDEEEYYTVRGIDALITASDYGLASNGDTEGIGMFMRIGRVLTELRMSAVGAFSDTLGAEESSLLAAVMTGERGLLEEDTKNTLATGGIAHILAVSGLHISLIAGGIYSLLEKLSGRKKVSCVVTVFFLILYGVFTGMPVSAARAIIMSSCMLIAKYAGKTYDSISALSVAGIIILTVNPLYITDTSFLMSFCAAGGAAYGNEVAVGIRIRKVRFKSIFMISGIYLFMLPVLMNTYYYVTPYSVLINLVVIPCMSLLVPGGAVCLLTTAVFGSEFARFTGGLCHYIIKAMLFMSDASEKLPFAKIITGHKSAAVLIIYYSVLVLVLILVETQRNKKPMWALLLCIMVFVRFRANETVIHMLDVGQGECIVIEDGEENIVIDAGSTSVSKLYKYRIGPFLKYEGIDRIDRLILTHADSDHKNAMEELFNDSDISVTEFICADVEDSGREIAEAASVQPFIRCVAAGDEIGLASGSRLHVVSPDGNVRSDKNDQSVVIEYIGKDVTALFTGDSSSKIEAGYMSVLEEQNIDILKVAHHGSKYSTSRELLEKTKPLVGIVSASATNRYGHPSADTLGRLRDAGCKTFDTPHCGYIMITCREGRISVRTMNGGNASG